MKIGRTVKRTEKLYGGMTYSKFTQTMWRKNMKKGTRGWISVKDLRNQLIELPGDWLLTPLSDEKRIHIANAATDTHMATVDCVNDKIVLEPAGKEALAVNSL